MMFFILIVEVVGDKVGYYNDGIVKWSGVFSQMEYSNGMLSAFLNISGSNSAYKRIDYFKKKDLVNELEKNGIETRSVMAGNISKQPVAKILKFKKSRSLKNSDYIHNNSFVIGNHHEIDEQKREFIADVIINFIIKNQK